MHHLHTLAMLDTIDIIQKIELLTCVAIVINKMSHRQQGHFIFAFTFIVNGDCLIDHVGKIQQVHHSSSGILRNKLFRGVIGLEFHAL
jgi:hypothetical protein